MQLIHPFHDGELEIQRRAGVGQEASAVGRGLSSTISSAAARFLASQHLAVAASLDAAGQPWASPLTGPPGFLQAVDAHLLRVLGRPGPGDPLEANLRSRPELGLLVLDPATRQRMRFNGRALLRDDGLFLLTEQVYGNCPKYIQKRRLVAIENATSGEPVRSERLHERQQARIARADTFFVASFHTQGGADASHRGGRPGFVRVLDGGLLTFDDYPGNNMFNTLGNLARYQEAGLLFLDFETGDALQLAGRATLCWPARVVEFRVSAVLETRRSSSLRYELVEYSPSNP